MNESDRQRSDTETIVRLEDVYTGEADPLEAMRDDSGGDNADGERHGCFGSYTNGTRTGAWTYYRNGERESTTEY